MKIYIVFHEHWDYDFHQDIVKIYNSEELATKEVEFLNEKMKIEQFHIGFEEKYSLEEF